MNCPLPTLKKISALILLLSSITIGNAQLLDTYDISGSPNGIIPFPGGLPSAFNSFVKYTKLQAPNGQAIHFIAQNQVTDAQIVRARNMLQFYLTNVSGSIYGANKAGVMNAMGNNEATLMLLNGSDGDTDPPMVNGQPLYENEMAVEGHVWYITNDYENHRDASFEEILHMMHDTGIGVDGPDTLPGALPAYQAEIRAAQQNAISNDFAIWPLGADGSDPDVQNWYNELAAENSLSQEYLAAVVDTYYGLWEAWPESTTIGFNGLYPPRTRAEITTEDPMGAALMPRYFSPVININFDIDPSFNGIFNMTRTTSEPYTFKSQYLQHLTLTGANNTGIRGNALENNLNGNDANNTLEGLGANDVLDGKGGLDVAIFTGNLSEYTLTSMSDHVIVQDNTTSRDATDLVYNCQTLRFADQDVDAVLGLNDNDVISTATMFPNPGSSRVTIQIDSVTFDSIDVIIYDLQGKIVRQLTSHSNVFDIEISSLQSGLYIVNLQSDDNGPSINKRLIIR